MLPNGTYIVAIYPEFATPQSFRRETFDDRDDFRRTITWHRLQQITNMILIRSYLEKLNLVTIRDF